MFGFGRGKVLLKGVGKIGTDQPLEVKKVAVAGGTRKAGHIQVVTANQLHNLPAILKAGMLRPFFINKLGGHAGGHGMAWV